MNASPVNGMIGRIFVLAAVCCAAVTITYSALGGHGGVGPGFNPGGSGLSSSFSSISDRHSSSGKKLTGITEPIPDRVFRIMPYNDWPVLRVDVHEGQRLTWRRKNGGWVGDNDVLTTQFETPAEIDGVIEAAARAKIELEAARSKAEMALIEAENVEDQARIRATNARQELDRMTGLKRRDAESLESHHRSENMWKLASVELATAEKVLALQRKLTESEVRIAESRLVQAQSELDLANFKRDMSWGKVPVHLIKGNPDQPRQLVVTRVSVAVGDQPPRNGAAPVWVELVDDSKLFVRTTIAAEQEDAMKPGMVVRLKQRGREYAGKVVALLPVVESRTEAIPILLEVDNPERTLRIGSVLEITLQGPET